jgi:hypothetical protein
MEKSVITPDQYPLTLNSLTNACNQKSGRNPVMSLDKGVVQHTVRDLGVKHLVHIDENFKTGVEKYRQRFCNSTFGDFHFDPAQFAIICLLLLRGPQTPGELRVHSGRLHSFADNAAVVDTLVGLMERRDTPLLAKLQRTPGRKDSEYMHLFSGSVDAAAHARQAPAAGTRERVSVPELAQRVDRLEAELEELRKQLNSLL